jgi:hypothetical protein
MLGPIESVTGVLMCGLSASALFAIVARLIRHQEPFFPALLRIPVEGEQDSGVKVKSILE